MPFVPTDEFPVDFLPSGDVRPLAPVVWTGTHGDSVTIGAGRRSDLGTVPKLLRGVLPHDGAAARAFLVHDELCERLHEHQRALGAWERGVKDGRGGMMPDPPQFDAVDTDAVLRVILAELGVGPVRWIYWEGVRAGALGSRERRRGFLRPRSLVPFLLLAPVALVAVLPAAVGGLVSRALLGLFALVCWPWEARARTKRAQTVDRVRRVARGRATIARAGLGPESLPCQYEPFVCALRLHHPGDHVPARAFAVPPATVRPVVLPQEGTTVELRDDDAEALTGSVLDRAARDYFGPDYPDRHGDHPNRPALVAFRAGWRRGVNQVSKSRESATRTETGEARRARAIEVGDFIDCGALIAPLDPGPCADCRNGCPVVGGPCSEVGLAIAARQAGLVDDVMALDPDNDGRRDCLCPPGNEAPAGGDCQHPTCPRDETPGGTR